MHLPVSTDRNDYAIPHSNTYRKKYLFSALAVGEYALLVTRRLSKHILTGQGDLNIEMLVSETVIRLIIGLLLQLRISIGSLSSVNKEWFDARDFYWRIGASEFDRLK